MKFIDLGAQQKTIRAKIENRVLNVLDHGRYIMGPEVFELEEKLAEYVGVSHCITCASGTDALLMPLMAKGIGPGDAVITTPFTYIATAEVIALLGAEPVFADIYPNTFNIDPYEIEKAIKRARSKGLHPKAIIPVDLFGLPARYRMIEELASEENLLIIEDAAQGFGGSIRSNKAGSFGNVASTSFFPAKPLGCYGDGGAIFTDDENLSAKIKSIRVHGGGTDKYENIRIGINGRLDTIQAAILLEKLSIFNSELQMRNQIADYYNEKINSQFQKPHVPDKYFSSWAQYSLLARDEDHKNKIMETMKTSDIPIMVYYKIPLHLQKCFDKLNYNPGDFPVSEDCSKRIFSIPMHPYLQRKDQDFIIEKINSL